MELIKRYLLDTIDASVIHDTCAPFGLRYRSPKLRVDLPFDTSGRTDVMIYGNFNNAVIAASALIQRAVLLTNDQAFASVEGLTVESLQLSPICKE